MFPPQAASFPQKSHIPSPSPKKKSTIFPLKALLPQNSVLAWGSAKAQAGSADAGGKRRIFG